MVLVFISHEHQQPYVPPYTSIVAPVTKHTDVAKPLYSVQFMTSYVNMRYNHQNFLIDIDAPFIWHDCILQWNIYPGSCPANTLCTYPVSCEEYQCTDTRTTYSYKNPSCPPVTNGSTLPGWGYCTCPVNVVNPVTGSCCQALLNYDGFTVNTSNGRNVLTDTYGSYPNAACAPSSAFGSFPSDVTGVMAFSTSPYALPAYLYQPLKRSLAICFPSNSSAPGVLFFGSGPYYLLPQSNVDIKSLLSYTPLIKQPGSFGYFIRITSIIIKWSSIVLPADVTTKLSTIEPYTTLRSDIYKRVIWTFSFYTPGIPRAKPVAPFGLCFRTFTDRFVLMVPDIDLMFSNGNKWSISPSNSLKKVTKDVTCLAFIDGGATTEHAIVIGTLQFEDNFLEFDLENLTFGFSSSLLRRQTACANFNFTLTSSS
ncbi:hypothetical protein E3N88_05672 [Mikania micrantha]|uniref:Peptidase A1 domain-containing protein n=1 Tax=Mikania micrantha TaxID=192012 RepID=A0A5N6PMB1_9ASTR|nr:hypothetical protein E3N88_05672 [Mikania micrantha]